MSIKVGFIGAGNMAEAIASALTGKNICTSSDLFISEPNKERAQFMKEKLGMNIAPTSSDLVKTTDITILAVKPQVLPQVLEETFKTYEFTDEKKLIVSIAAGIKTETIEKTIYSFSGNELQQNYPVVRVMPNTPSLAGEGMSAVSGGKFAEEEDILKTAEIMESMGKARIVSEDKMNWVTAISGSGPAYFFKFIEALVSSGVKLGFTEEESFELVIQTARGSVALLEQTGESPSELRKKVTSKGGTTEAALNKFMEGHIDDLVFSAVKAASDRAEELSKG